MDHPTPVWLCGKLPWYPGYVSTLGELENPHLSFDAHTFFGPTVAAIVLGSALVHLQLHPLENFWNVNLVPTMVVPGSATFKNEVLERGLSIEVLPSKRINGAGVLKASSRFYDC